jgi:restriction system protein
LIDGDELARLMIEHEVGVRVKETYKLKSLDEEYFSGG